MDSRDETLTLPVPEAIPALREEVIPDRLSDRVFVLVSPGRGGLWCTTKGLGQFGLPELQTIDSRLRSASPGRGC